MRVEAVEPVSLFGLETAKSFSCQFHIAYNIHAGDLTERVLA